MKHLILPFLLPAALHAQVNCTELLVDGFSYTAFDPGLQVLIHNNSDEFISYPMCDVIDANGDTLIHAMAQTFGIGENSSQLHTMVMPFPVIASPFTGTIALHYTTIDGIFICDFEMDNVDLCPPAPCADLQVFAYGLTPSVNASLIWTVTDAGQNELATGGLQLNTILPPTAFDSLCLPPGFYTLNISQPFPTGEEIMVGLTTAFFEIEGPSGVTAIDGTLSLPFVFHLNCIDGTQGIGDQAITGPRVQVIGNLMEINSSDRSPIGSIAIMDSMGRIIRTAHSNDERLVIDLDGNGAGAFLVRPMDVSWPAQRFILN